MVIILCVAWSLIYLIRLGQGQKKIRAALDATVCFSTLTVLGCEGLSLLKACKALPLFLFWLVMCALLAAIGYKALIAGWQRLCESRTSRIRWYAWIGGAIIAVFALGTLLCAVLYPPMNYDSLTYHMTRVFFWFKNSSVFGYPTQAKRQLTGGPLNAMYILQLVLLTGGDRLANLAHWFAYLGAILAVAGIAAELGAGPRGRWIAAILAATTQLAILQASTTQNDLLAAFWGLVPLYYLCVYWRGLPATRGARLGWAVGIGCAVGLAIASKLTALYVLAPFALLTFALMLKRRAWKDIGTLVAPVLICTLLVSGGSLLQNADFTGGDALMLNSSGLVKRDQQVVRPQQTIMQGSMIIANSVSGWPVNRLNRFIDRGIAKLSDWLDVPTDDPAISSGVFAAALQNAQSHDTRTSPMHSAWVYVSLAILLLYALFRRKGRTFCAAYALAIVAAILASSLLKRWFTSTPRYMLPVLMAALPLIPIVWRKGRVMRGMACCGLLATLTLGGMSMLQNTAQPLLPAANPQEAGRHTYSYDDLRAVGMGSDPAKLEAFEDQVRTLGATSIGIEQYRKSGAIYPFLTMWWDRKYDVRYINASILPEREDPAFVPDIILAIDKWEGAPETMEYHGTTYVKTFYVGTMINSAYVYIPKK